MFSPKINYTFNSGNLFLGYNMEFITGCITFKDAVGDESYTHEDKLRAINVCVYSKELIESIVNLVSNDESREVTFPS